MALTLYTVSSPNCFDELWYLSLSGGARYQSAVALSPSRKQVRGSQPAECGPCRCWRTSPGRPRRRGMVKTARRRCRKARGRRGDVADRRLAARADVERLAVVLRSGSRPRRRRPRSRRRRRRNRGRSAGSTNRVGAFEAVADHVGDQPGGVLERPIDRIEPQVGAGELLALAVEVEQVGGGDLGDGVVAVGPVGSSSRGPAALSPYSEELPGVDVAGDRPRLQPGQQPGEE